MKEIEVKGRVLDLEVIKQKLLALGCTFSSPKIQKDRIYLPKGIEITSIRKGTVILRIRDSNGTIIVTLKKQLENELDNIEREVIINDSSQMHELILLLDFHEVIFISKKRITCKYKDVEICLDEVEGLGPFIEVEKLTTDENSLEVQKELFALLESLGVTKKDHVLQGYDTLLYNAQMSSK